MKKIFVFTLLLASCTTESSIPKKKSAWKTIYRTNEHDVNYKSVKIEGCEYFLLTDTGLQNGGYSLCHKGNCKNYKHH